MTRAPLLRRTNATPLRWVIAVSLTVVGASADRLASAQGAVVERNALSVRDGVLRLGTDACCASGSDCSAQFLVRNQARTPLRGVRFEPSSLSGPDGGVVGADAWAVSPPGGATIEVKGELVVRVELAVASDVSGGQYRGVIALTAPRAVLGKLEVVVDVCDPIAALRLLPGVGDFGSDGVHARPVDGCDGTRFEARVVVAATGEAPIVGAVPVLDTLVRDLVVGFDSRPLALVPGETRELLVTVVAPDALRAGVHGGVLKVSDASTGASDSAPFTFERCASPSDPDEEIEVDRPVALERSRLRLSHRASRRGLRVGDVFTLTCTVRNDGPGAAREVVIVDELPAGFEYVRGRAAIDRREAEPTSVAPLRFRIGDLDVGREVTVAFQAVVTTSARRGASEARAWAHASDDSVGPVVVELEVSTSSVGPLGVIAGRVELGRGGLGGVTLLLDSDREVVSDDEGEFAFEAVEGGEHVVSVDRRTLPPGHWLDGSDFTLLRLFPGTRTDASFRAARSAELGVTLRRVTVSRDVRPTASPTSEPLPVAPDRQDP